MTKNKILRASRQHVTNISDQDSIDKNEEELSDQESDVVNLFDNREAEQFHKFDTKLATTFISHEVSRQISYKALSEVDSVRLSSVITPFHY